MLETILFATRNPFKAQLFAPAFAGDGLRCLTLRDAGIEGPDVAEVGTTPEANALLKTRAYHSATWPLVFGVDGGIEIDALDGEPGLQARRWGGRFGDEVDDETWLAYLLHRMEGIPLPQRTARFVAAWVLIAPDGTAHTRRVCHPFTIAERQLRPILPGSPISAVDWHDEDHLARRCKQVAADWAKWGILDKLALKQDQT